jgi:hypothetical protein
VKRSPATTTAAPVASVLLGDEGTPADAVRLVERLTIEGIGAVADGPRVWVHPAQHTEAFVLARLFSEVDRKASKVAPWPRGMWRGSVQRRLAGATIVALVVFALLVVVFTAVRAV